MTDILGQIDREIEDTESEIKRLELRVKGLRQAKDALSPFYGSSPIEIGNGSIRPDRDESENAPITSLPVESSSSDPQGDLAGVNIEDAAAKILAEQGGEGLPSDEIARKAMERGYRSNSPRNPTNDPKKIETSFRVTLKRYSQRFERDGKVFRLRH